MLRFRKTGTLRKHDIGTIADTETKKYGGMALCCGPSNSHPTSVSINSKEFEFAQEFYQYLVLRCVGNKEKIIIMVEATKLIETCGRRPNDYADYLVVNWNDVESWTDSDFNDELPF
jgi:hypothetical protein